MGLIDVAPVYVICTDCIFIARKGGKEYAEELKNILREDVIFAADNYTILKILDYFAHDMTESHPRLTQYIKRGEYSVCRNPSGVLYWINYNDGAYHKVVNAQIYLEHCATLSEIENGILEVRDMVDYYFNMDIICGNVAPSTISKRLFNTLLEMHGETVLGRCKISDFVKMRGFISGGLCLFNEKTAGKVIENCYKQDVKSSYPFEFARLKWITGADFDVHEGMAHHPHKKELRIYVVNIQGYLKPDRLPCWNDRLTGLQCTYFEESDFAISEIELDALQDSYELFVDVLYTIDFEGRELVAAKKFADALFKIKEREIGARQQLAKRVINMVTGVLCAHRGAISPINAGRIYGNARARMYERIRKCGEGFYYTDTDSIFSNADISEGNELGQLAMKGKGSFCALGKKCYAFDAGKFEARVSGMPREIATAACGDIITFSRNPAVTYLINARTENGVEKIPYTRKLTANTVIENQLPF